jgi:hypothetical protein
MTDRVHYHPELIFSVGTQVVTLIAFRGHWPHSLAARIGRRRRESADRS